MEQLRKNFTFFTSKKSFKNHDAVINRVNDLLSQAVLKLEEEFKQLLSTYRFVSRMSTLFFFAERTRLFIDTLSTWVSVIWDEWIIYT